MTHIYLSLVFISYLLIGMNIFFALSYFRLFEIEEDDPWFWTKILTFWLVPTFLWPIGLLVGLWWVLSHEYRRSIS